MAMSDHKCRYGFSRLLISNINYNKVCISKNGLKIEYHLWMAPCLKTQLQTHHSLPAYCRWPIFAGKISGTALLKLQYFFSRFLLQAFFICYFYVNPFLKFQIYWIYFWKCISYNNASIILIYVIQQNCKGHHHTFGE